MARVVLRESTERRIGVGPSDPYTGRAMGAATASAGRTVAEARDVAGWMLDATDELL